MATQTENTLFDLPPRERVLVRGPPLSTPPPVIQHRAASIKDLKLYALSQGLGLEAAEDTKLEVQLGFQARLCPPGQKGTYLAPAFRLANVNAGSAKRIFNACDRDVSTKHTITWYAGTPEMTWTLTGQLQDVKPKICWGSSKALKVPSEYFFRKVARYIQVKVSHVTRKARTGGSRRLLYVNALYVVMDDKGELHLPKDKYKVQLAFSEEELQRVRVCVLEDVEGMAEAGFNLSAAWLERLGPAWHKRATAAAATETWMSNHGGALPPEQPAESEDEEESEEEEEEEEESE
jgi:hypothetical protein